MWPVLPIPRLCTKQHLLRTKNDNMILNLSRLEHTSNKITSMLLLKEGHSGHFPARYGCGCHPTPWTRACLTNPFTESYARSCATPAWVSVFLVPSTTPRRVSFITRQHVTCFALPTTGSPLTADSLPACSTGHRQTYTQTSRAQTQSSREPVSP